MLFKEYFKDPIATKEAFTDDGYYKTGDIADIDEDVSLFLLFYGYTNLGKLCS